MKAVFFIVVSLLSVLWLYLSFYFFKLDNSNTVNSGLYNTNLFEAIFFVGLFVFGFFLGRFFCFDNKKNIEDDIENQEKSKDEKSNNFFTETKEEGKEDNLKIIEGIGPKVEQLLKLNSINTIKQLSEASYDEIKMILERAGDNFKIINPRSWPYQAELAYKKEWGKLKEYQDFLVGGIDPNEFNK